MGIAIGDHVLFSYQFGYGVARVDIVRDREVTVYPFNLAKLTWDRRNRRIMRGSIIGTLSPHVGIEAIAAALNRIQGEHEAKRRNADMQLQRKVAKMTHRGFKA